MKILVYGISAETGGISEFMMNISDNIDVDKIQFDYIITGDTSVYERKIIKNNGKVFFISSKKKIIKNISQIYSILKKNRKNHEILYYNTSGIYYAIPLLFALLFKYKIIVHAHNCKDETNGCLYTVLNKFNRRIFRNHIQKKLACSDLAGEWVFGTNDNVEFIRNGIDLSKLKYDEKKRNSLRDKMNIRNDELVIGNVGRLTKVKNQKFILEIFDLILKEKRNSKLLLIGDGDQKHHLLPSANKMKITDKVIFYGNSNNVSKLLLVMDFFVFPSRNEGFPITLVESQATGLKSIISDNITQQVKITDLVYFKNLNESANEWKKYILENYQYNRKDYSKIIEKKGFSRIDIANQISTILQKLGED